jgi:hypothetical protein
MSINNSVLAPIRVADRADTVPIADAHRSKAITNLDIQERLLSTGSCGRSQQRLPRASGVSGWDRGLLRACLFKPGSITLGWRLSTLHAPCERNRRRQCVGCGDSRRRLRSLRRRLASGRSGAFPRARVCLSKLGERHRIDRLQYLRRVRTATAPTTQPKLIFASRLVRESAFEIASSSVTLPCL